MISILAEIPYSSKFLRSKTSVNQPVQLLTDNNFREIHCCSNRHAHRAKHFVDTIFVIHFTPDLLTSLELYGGL